MKRTQKKVVGFLSLAAVIAMTAAAIMMPTPDTHATASSTSFTDNLTVRVVGDEVRVEINSPVDGSQSVLPGQTIKYLYERAERITVTMEYTDMDGNTYPPTVLKDFDAGYVAGDDSFDLNLYDYGYGYGYYKIKVAGVGDGGVTREDAKVFEFLPVITSTVTDEDTGESTITVDYDTNSPNIKTIVVNVYDEAGNLVEGLSPITITPPNTEFKFNVNDYGLEGKYLVETAAYSGDGTRLYKYHDIYVNYHVNETKVPDTGGMLGNTNISQTDYLITGLIVFSIVAIAGVTFATKKR